MQTFVVFQNRRFKSGPTCFRVLLRIAAAGVLAVCAMAVTDSPCLAGMIVGRTNMAATTRQAPTSSRPSIKGTPTVQSKSQEKQTGRPASSPRSSRDVAGAGPLDFTKRNPTPSVFAESQTSQSSTGILGLCLEMTRDQQNLELMLPMVDLSGNLRSESEPAVAGSIPGQAVLPDDPSGAFLNALLNPPGLPASWQGIDAFQMGLAKLESGAQAVPGGLVLADLGNLYVPSMLAGPSDGSSFSTCDGASDGPRHYVSSEAMARGVSSSGGSSSSGSTDDRPPMESAGNLLWFLAAALGVYPLLRGKSSNRPAFA